MELNASTSGDAEKLRRLLHSVPFIISDLRQFNDGVIEGRHVENGEEEEVDFLETDKASDAAPDMMDANEEQEEVNAVLKTDKTSDAATDAKKHPDNGPTTPPKSHWKERLISKTTAPDAKRALVTDGIVTWVDLTRHSDVFKRTYLLLNTNDMIADNIPTPYTVRLGGEDGGGGAKSGYWALGENPGVEENGCDYQMNKIGSNASEDHPSPSPSPTPYYLPVTPSSPLYAIDVEMCRGADGTLLPVWIAVVDEKLQQLYSSLIRPTQRVVDYLTPYSGVTKSMLKDVTTTIKDVARELRLLLPADAILVGHQIGCDMESLKLVHPYVVDTVKILNLKGDPELRSKLRDLTRSLLGKNIQEFATAAAANGSVVGEETGNGVNGGSGGSSSSTSSYPSSSSSKPKLGHNPVEDARATMELVLLKLRNHPMFGNLGFPAGVLPDEWQKMPVKFLKWYENVAARQKVMRVEMSTGGGGGGGGGNEPNSAEEDPSDNTAAASQSHSKVAAAATTTTPTNAVIPTTPSSSLKKVLTLTDEDVTNSITVAFSSSPPSSSSSSRPFTTSNNRLSLQQAFDLTSEIFPSADVGTLLAQDGKYAAEFTVESEAEITIDRMQGGCGYYTSFVIKDSHAHPPTKEDFLKRVDRCVGKIVEYLPKLSLINVVFSGNAVSGEDKVGEGESENANGLVLVDIL